MLSLLTLTHCVLVYADIFNNELISVRAWFSVRRFCSVGWANIILSSVTFAPANGSIFFPPDVAFLSLSNVLAIAISHHKFRWDSGPWLLIVRAELFSLQIPTLRQSSLVVPLCQSVKIFLVQLKCHGFLEQGGGRVTPYVDPESNLPPQLKHKTQLAIRLSLTSQQSTTIRLILYLVLISSSVMHFLKSIYSDVNPLESKHHEAKDFICFGHCHTPKLG